MFQIRRGSRKGTGLAVGLAALTMAAAAGWAQESGADSAAPKRETREEMREAPGEGASLRRLETVTWNPVTDELTWVVSAGTKSAGVYNPATKETYLIQLESATMKLKGEGRLFSRDEADSVHMLMDLIAKYAVESTVWWEEGLGQKIDENGKPVPGQPAPGQKEGEGDKPHRSLHPSNLPVAEGHGQPRTPANPQGTSGTPPDQDRPARGGLSATVTRFR
jgi:hypothetical protein